MLPVGHAHASCTHGTLVVRVNTATYVIPPAKRAKHCHTLSREIESSSSTPQSERKARPACQKVWLLKLHCKHHPFLFSAITQLYMSRFGRARDISHGHLC
jgi:hypothetical protein